MNMMTAIAITDMELVHKIYGILPTNLQEQIKSTYPNLFEDEVVVKAGNRYFDKNGEEYILAHEYGHVALVSLKDGSILNTVSVSNVNRLTNEEIEEVFNNEFDEWEGDC